MFGDVILDNEDLSKLCDKIESSLFEVIGTSERNRCELDSDLKISYNFVDSVMNLNFNDADTEIRRMRTFDKEHDLSRPIALTRKVSIKISKIEEMMRPKEMEEENISIGRMTLTKDPRTEIFDEPAEVRITSSIWKAD